MNIDPRVQRPPMVAPDTDKERFAHEREIAEHERQASAVKRAKRWWQFWKRSR